MIAFPPQKRPTLQCPQCGDDVVVRFARNSGKWQIYHPLTHWCDLRGAAWYGATRAEAVENFQKEVKSCPPSVANAEESILSANVGARTAAPKVPPSGAATLQGWEFSAEGLSEEEINSLLTEREAT